MISFQVQRNMALVLVVSLMSHQVAFAFPSAGEKMEETTQTGPRSEPNISFPSASESLELVPYSTELLKEALQVASRSTQSVNPSFIPSGTTLALFSMLIPAVAAQGSDALSAEAPMIDSTVACIIARELLEGAMFATSHIGAVTKNTGLSPQEKENYLKRLIPALACGVITGGIISVAVGFSVAQAIGSLDTVANGVEAGEGASKAIGAFFVSSLTLKIPQWFGISNYHKHLPETDIENQNAENPPINAIGSRMALSMSLFWNTLRESTEGGVLTALAVLLSKNSMAALGPSIGVGAGSALVVGGGLALGAKYVSPKAFGITSACIAELLTIGLVTGAVRSFEQVYAAGNDEASTPVLYDFGGTQLGDTLTAFEFMGISDKLTALTLATGLATATTLTGLQIWHNYYGKPLVPMRVKNWARGAKQTLSAPFRSCWNSHSEHPVTGEAEIEILPLPPSPSS